MGTVDENGNQLVGLKGRVHHLLLAGELFGFQYLELLLIKILCMGVLGFEIFQLPIRIQQFYRDT